MSFHRYYLAKNNWSCEKYFKSCDIFHIWPFDTRSVRTCTIPSYGLITFEQLWFRLCNNHEFIPRTKGHTPCLPQTPVYQATEIQLPTLRFTTRLKVNPVLPRPTSDYYCLLAHILDYSLPQTPVYQATGIQLTTLRFTARLKVNPVLPRPTSDYYCLLAHILTLQ